MSAPIPVARTAEFKRLCDEFCRAHGLDEHNGALMLMMRHAYLCGSSDGVEEGVQIYRDVTARRAKAKGST